MLVIKKRQRQFILGSGFGDFINFINTHKDTISNVAGVVGNVAKAGSTTAIAAKEIYDAIKARKGSGLPPRVRNTLNDKSIDILNKILK
jgi:hypothetical protein